MIPTGHIQMMGDILVDAMYRRIRDKYNQGLWNNLWDNNPGELERWADDGGRQWDDARSGNAGQT